MPRLAADSFYEVLPRRLPCGKLTLIVLGTVEDYAKEACGRCRKKTRRFFRCKVAH